MKYCIHEFWFYIRRKPAILIFTILIGWSENSAKGGRNYPDSGTDYVLQTVPTTWTIQDEKMIAIYDNDPYIGREGQEFFIGVYMGWRCHHIIEDYS